MIGRAVMERMTLAEGRLIRPADNERRTDGRAATEREMDDAEMLAADGWGRGCPSHDGRVAYSYSLGVEIEIEIDEFGDDGERGNAHMGAIGRASLLGIIIRIQD